MSKTVHKMREALLF